MGASSAPSIIYVDQAHAQEDISTVTSVGFDETASRRGHNYMSLFHDLDAPRGLYACEGRKAQVVAQFAEALEAHGACAENIGVVCMDMSASYQAGVCEHRPWAAITFDEFHAIQLVNKAVDEVRRQEVKRVPELPGASPFFAKPEMGSVRFRVQKIRRRPWPSAAYIPPASVPARTPRDARTPAMT